MKLCIKQPESESWLTDLTQSDVEQRFSAGQITGEWLVCPLGEVDRAIEVSRFLAEPTVFGAETLRASSKEATFAAPLSIPRRHDLDALRATAMLLGIVLHSGMAYLTRPWWPIRDERTHIGFDVFIAGLHGFRMPLFFIISGYFTAMLWRRRGLRSLIKHRMKRILVPFVVLLIPVQVVTIALLFWANPQLSTTEDDDAVCLAAKNNDLADLKRICGDGASPNSQDSVHQLHALSWAAFTGSLDAAEFLIEEALANPNSESPSDKSTPLSYAVQAGQTEMVAYLLKHGARVNALDAQDRTPLDIASDGPERVSELAATLEVTVDLENLAENRSAAASLLKDAGGLPAPDLLGEDAPLLSVVTLSYQRFSDWYWFHSPQLLGHLWFLWMLSLFLVPFALWTMVADRINWKGPPDWMFRSPTVLLWVVPLTMVPQWFNGLKDPMFGADTSVTIVPAPHILALYFVFFFIGTMYFDCERAERGIGRYWWLAIPVSLFLVFPIGMLALLEPDHEWLRSVPPDKVRFLAVFLQALFAWLMSFGMIGLFRKVFARENKTVRFVSDSSYWLYVAHIPLVFPVQALLKPLNISPFIKQPLVFLIITCVLLVSYRYMVRYTWLGTMLNGKRERPAKAIA